MRTRILLAVVAALVLTGTHAQAVSDADKCEAAKNKTAGKYAFCRQKAEAKAIKTGAAVDYTQCDAKFGQKWMDAETNGGGTCPTNGDQTNVQNQITADADFIALKLTGVRFVDNGDGTVTDTQTGLMWEQKDNLGGGMDLSNPHDADNLYSWTTSGTSPDGTAYTDFLGKLNNGTSADGTAISGCFAGHCDWRLPTSAELQTILRASYPCEPSPCIDAAIGPSSEARQWSSTGSGNPILAWYVSEGDGFMLDGNKANTYHGRAVRGGS